MESDPTSDEPLLPAGSKPPAPTDDAPEAAAEPAIPAESTTPAEAGAEETGDPLVQFAERSAKSRLPAAEEEKATQLLTAVLLEGRDAVGRAVEILPRLPWVVGVNGVT